MRSDVRQYLETALWSSTHFADQQDHRGTSFDDLYDVSDFDDAQVKSVEQTLDDFHAYVAETLGDVLDAFDDTDIAHDLWLSRNGHGAGFFDGDYGEHGDALQAAAKTFGSCDLYVGDDGRMYFT
jgi:hypothetical protein